MDVKLTTVSALLVCKYDDIQCIYIVG